MNLVVVDPADTETFAAWHTALTEGLLADRPLGAYPTLADKTVEFTQESMALRRIAVLAFEGPTPVGAVEVELPILDNLHLLIFDLGVPPAHRRKGVGSLLLSYVEEVARKEGRGSLLTETSVPPEQLATAPGHAFARARGFESKNTEILRTMPLPISDVKLKVLGDKASERAGAYRIVGWPGAVPDEYAESYAELKGLLNAEAPMGGLDIEPEKWDVARLRDQEARVAAQGRTLYTAIAVAPDGTLAGHTQLVVTTTGRVIQWDTLVLDSHRGHRLGMALKVDNYRRMQDGNPEARRVYTWNAEQNGPMIAVNEDLGFEVTEVADEWQRAL